MSLKDNMFSDKNHREPLDPSLIKDGDIVAFEWDRSSNGDIKKGVAWMESGSSFYEAYNLFGDANDAGGVWVYDSLPDNITLFAPTKEEFLLAVEKFGGEGFGDASMNIPDKFPHDISLVDALEKMKKTVQEYDEKHQHALDRLISVIEKRNEEIDQLSQKIAEQENEYYKKLSEAEKRIKELELTVKKLEKRPSEDDFVKRLVKETKHFYKHDRKKADAIRQIMIKLGRDDADDDLDAWIEGKRKQNVNTFNNAQVTMQNPQINSPMYEIKDNGTVNLGGESNG